MKVFKEIAQMQQESEANSTHTEYKNHPLINEDSRHYRVLDDETITQFEKLFTKDELMAWAKISYYKYMFRLGKKDDVKSELKKMRTYENYYYYLKKERK